MQGFNMGRYYPPSTDSPPTFNAGRHPLGSRARKAGQGILTVRFEMPFAVWCTTCPRPTLIAQGVRFNAEKRRAGAYHSTPIWAFRMKHPACGGAIEIRTDPKNTEYVVTEGARRRDYGEDETRPGEGLESFGGMILTEEERERRRNDAFAAFEGKEGDKRQAKVVEHRVRELYQMRERDWSDPASANKRLRDAFRVERKARARKANVTEALKNKLSLGIDLVEENDDDARRAALVEFRPLGGDEARKAATKPLFATSSANGDVERGTQKTATPNTRPRREREAQNSKLKLQEQLRRNTWAAMDPFLLDSSSTTTLGSQRVASVKKKPTVDKEPEAAPSEAPPQQDDRGGGGLALVDYDSDD
ncbi:CWC16 protein [Lineolata rhizophorae]|uniref:CWC16 protein n=1 Tax=Lineolata rhizophorae TaxID=578093 RepID=A0A6A6NQZ8_9PEZI|nr:CWC16 protein [Lineolata rhizophorae]